LKTGEIFLLAAHFWGTNSHMVPLIIYAFRAKRIKLIDVGAAGLMMHQPSNKCSDHEDIKGMSG
jgi:hypothetical protein